MLCFVHVPKTAGKSVGVFFRRSAPFRRAIGPMTEERFRSTADARLARQLIVSAHLAHSDLERIQRIAVPPVVTTALLRDPSQRFVSHFFYIKGFWRHAWHWRCRDLTLEQALQDREITAELDNYQIRYLARALLPEGLTEPDPVAKVLAALDTVGDVSCLAASALLLLYRAGIPPKARLRVLTRRRGASRYQPASAAALAYIDQELNHYDRQLYAEGRTRFLQDFAAMARDLGMEGLDPRTASKAELEACRKAACRRLRQ